MQAFLCTLILLYLVVISSTPERKASAMQLTTLFCVLLIATSAWGYADECAKGPEYWCRDASTAEDCGAVRHCQQTVWFEKNNLVKPTAIDGEAQLLCKILVQASSEVLANGFTEMNTIKQALRRNCTQLPGHKNIFRRCVMTIDRYLSDILRHIESGIEINQICPMLQRLDSQIVHRQMAKHENVSLKSVECTFCKYLIGYVDTVTQNNRTPAAIEAQLEKACNILPATLKDNCTRLVKKYGPIIAILLATNATPVQVCNFIKLCTNGTQETNSASTNHMFPMKESFIRSAQCSLCRYIANYMDAFIQHDRSDAVIESAFGSVCSALAEPLKHKCNQFVQTHRQTLISHAQKYNTEARVCDALKLC